MFDWVYVNVMLTVIFATLKAYIKSSHALENTQYADTWDV